MIVHKLTSEESLAVQIARAEKRAELLRMSGDERRALIAEVEALEMESRLKLGMGMYERASELSCEARVLRHKALEFGFRV